LDPVALKCLIWWNLVTVPFWVEAERADKIEGAWYGEGQWTWAQSWLDLGTDSVATLPVGG
jgi:hypothetical protein